MIAKLVECSDYDVEYGVLTVVDKTAEEVQEKIDEIKTRFWEEDVDDWSITDVLAEFPEDWDWNFNSELECVSI